jgi:hypothetical protein
MTKATCTPVKPVPPKEINTYVQAIQIHLGLVSHSPHIVSIEEQKGFDAEPDCCRHLNVWVKYLREGGIPVFGWIFGYDEKTEFVEAQFHSVWQSENGHIIDVTPRSDGGTFNMFLRDDSRQIILTRHQGRPAIRTFDNIRLMNNRLINGLQEIVVVPETNMIKKYGLDAMW